MARTVCSQSSMNSHRWPSPVRRKKKIQSLFSDFHNSREEVKEYFFLDKGSFKKVQRTFKNGKKAGRKRFAGEKALESVK